MYVVFWFCFLFSSRRRHTSSALVTGVQTCALPIWSYVSFESALAHHGWIPEAVFVTASVSPGRKSLSFATADFGTFSFHPLAIKDYRFLTGVGRIKMGKITAFVASPLRALMDLVAMRKERWTGIDRSEEHTTDLQSLMRSTYAVFSLKI